MGQVIISAFLSYLEKNPAVVEQLVKVVVDLVLAELAKIGK